MSDVRYAIRALAKNPAFSLTVVGVLTLGIGLNAAVFTMLKSMALSPLAGVDGSARLARHLRRDERRPSASAVSYPDYQYLRDHDRAFSGLFGIERRQPSTSAEAAARASLWAELVTGNYFQVLGVRAAARPHAAAVGRNRARAAIRWSCSAMGCGDATSAPIPTSSARPSRSTTTR